MKLSNELKSHIDKYFVSISAEELYNVLTNKYHFLMIQVHRKKIKNKGRRRTQ